MAEQFQRILPIIFSFLLVSMSFFDFQSDLFVLQYIDYLDKDFQVFLFMVKQIYVIVMSDQVFLKISGHFFRTFRTT